MKKFIPFGALIFIVALALVFPSAKTVTIANNKIDSGDTRLDAYGYGTRIDYDPGPVTPEHFANSMPWGL